MKLLPSYLNNMYASAIFALLVCAAASAYVIGVFPVGLAAAVIACAGFDVAAKLLRKKVFAFPASAVITGIIIGSIAPIDAPLAGVIFASAVAIASKHLVKLKGRHIFNPATVGLLASLLIFKLGDVWWAASGFNILGLPLTLILIIPNFRARKLYVSLPFLAATGLLYAASGLANLATSSIVPFVASLPFYFAFIMLSEPKTSPYAPVEQVVFGLVAAVAVFALDSILHVRYSFLVTLLALNLAFAAYRYVMSRRAVAN
ncbi:RnfABCDGE type electron transport complex subunit D [Candidatus Woesearchaeota archaeon]|nr:RnfABCDGE type electron transport complex subunit D [Candidatus Woesearchaeota archaeon]